MRQPAAAQGGLATVNGTVRDPSGAVVPAANVALSNEKSGELRQTTTNAQGFFSFVGVPQGTYALFVTKKGFTTLHKTAIVVPAFATMEVPGLTLQAGAVTQTVTVEGTNYYQVPLASGSKTHTITEQQIQNTPLEGRSAVEMLKILPGVVNTGYNAVTTGFNAGGGVGSFHVNGARNDQLAMYSNGADNIDIGNSGGAVAIPDVDMVSEVTVQTSNYGAENSAGPVVINTTTKSGGAAFHGELYFTLREPSWNAIDASNTSHVRPNAHFYYPGGNIGGPVLIPGTSFNKHRDKMFFWFGYEYAKQEQALPQMNGNVPTPSMAKGFFADPADAPIYSAWSTNGYAGQVAAPLAAGQPLADMATDPCIDPAIVGTAPTWSVNPKTGAPVTITAPTWWTTYGGFAGACSGVGQMNAANFDPGGLAMFKQIASVAPTPNNTPTGAFPYDFISNEIQPVNHQTYTGRIDYDFSPYTKLYVTLDHETEFSSDPYGLWWGGSTIPYPGGMTTNDFSDQVTGSLINVLSPEVTNELQVALSRLRLPWSPSDPALDSTSALGYPYNGVFTNTTGFMPSLNANVNGVPNLINAQGNTVPNTFAAKWLVSGRDDLSWVHGNHLVKAGVFYMYLNNLQPTGDPRGAFSPSIAGMPPNLDTNNAYGQLLLGWVSNFAQQNAETQPSIKGNDFEAYLEDSWKAMPRLTLDLGVRMYYMPWYYSTLGNIFVFQPYDYRGPYCSSPGLYGCGTGVGMNPFAGGDAPLSAYSGLAARAFDPLVPFSGAPNPGVRFAPHFGFAYDLTGHASSVLRGGFGEYFYRDQVNVFTDAAANPPLVSSVTLGAGGGIGYTLAQINGNPALIPGATRSNIQTLNPTDTNIPKTYSYSLTLSQKLPARTVMEISYVGSSSHNNITPGAVGNGGYDYNAVPQGAETPAYLLWGPAGPPQTGCSATPPAPPAGNPGCVTIFDNNYKPYANYGVITLQTHDEQQNYNSLQVTATRTTERLMYSLAYTFSKALGVSGEFNGGGSPVDFFDTRGRSYGPLYYDRTNQFTAALSVVLPNVGTLTGGSGVADAVLNGWQLTDITTFTSGAPVVPTMGATSGGAGGANFSASYIAGTPDTTVHPFVTCNPTANLAANELYNAACFESPAIGFNGDYQLPYIHGPQFFDSDLGLYKNFALNRSESQRLQIRAEAFNFLNHPNFTTGGPFGTIIFNNGVPAGTVATPACNRNPACGYFQPAPASPVGGPGYVSQKTGGRILELEAKYIF